MAGIGSMYRQSAGKMRHRITVKRRSIAPDASGQPIPTFIDRFQGEPAGFTQVSGGEVLRGRQIEAGVTAVFVVNWRAGYDETDIIVFEGVEYGIVRIHKPEGIARFAEIHCKAVK